ncbi:MAG: endonuclease domain-containing protein [Sulfurisoma sp.]|nr:endonuclease domain-containing protein [Sulfurisoma sp.]
MVQRQFVKALRQQMTEAEHLLWRHLRAHRLNGAKFRRQQPVGPYIVDFVHFGARLVVEADGGQHNASPTDARRDAWLKSQGFRVMRFWNDEILRNTEAVLEVVMAAVQDAPPLPQPLPREGGGEGPALSPATWDGFFASIEGANVPADFLDKNERNQGTQDRDPFDGQSE